MILYAAAGVYVSTGSYINVVGNMISYSPRWGIAIRSEETSYSLSSNNLVELNHVHHTGLATSDLGAISVIAWLGSPDVNSTIRHNCVRNVLGMNAIDGVMVQGYDARGLYLDNEASGYLVEGNIFRYQADVQPRLSKPHCQLVVTHALTPTHWGGGGYQGSHDNRRIHPWWGQQHDPQQRFIQHQRGG